MSHSKPIAMGAFMGLMMLFMMHQMMTGDAEISFIALATFAGAHILLALIAVIGTLFAARLSPRARASMTRLHRPNLAHFGVMLASAAISAGVAHLFIHGGVI